MSESPGDLAVAFRSFGRRLDEAMAPVARDPALADAGSPSPRQLTAQLRDVVAEAAGAMRIPATDDVRASGSAIADAIAATPADVWTDEKLDHLRALALEAGRLLRQIDQAVRAATS